MAEPRGYHYQGINLTPLERFVLMLLPVPWPIKVAVAWKKAQGRPVPPPWTQGASDVHPQQSVPRKP